MFRIVWETALAPNCTIGSLEAGLNQVTVRNHHDTLAQLRPGQATVGGPWYQSLRHVAFVQHKSGRLAGGVQVALQQADELGSRNTTAVSFAGRIAERMLRWTAVRGWQE